MARFADDEASDFLAVPPLGVAAVALLATEDEGGRWEAPTTDDGAEPPFGVGDDLVRLTACGSADPGSWLPVLSEGLSGRPPDEDKRCRFVDLSGAAVVFSDPPAPTVPTAMAKPPTTEDATLDLREERPAWIGI